MAFRASDRVLARVDRRGQRDGRRRMPRGGEDGLRGREPRGLLPGARGAARRTTCLRRKRRSLRRRTSRRRRRRCARSAGESCSRRADCSRGCAPPSARTSTRSVGLRPRRSCWRSRTPAGSSDRPSVPSPPWLPCGQRFPGSPAAGTAAFTLGRIVFEKRARLCPGRELVRDVPAGAAERTVDGRRFRPLDGGPASRRRQPPARATSAEQYLRQVPGRTILRGGARVFCRGEPSGAAFLCGADRSRYLLSLVAAAGIALHAGEPAGGEPAQRRWQRRMIDRRVLLLVDSPGDPFMDRIRAEVVSLGLEVVVRAPQGSIEASARAEHAVAAIRILAVAQRRRGVDGRRDVRAIVAPPGDRRRDAGRAEPGRDRVADRRALAHRSVSRAATREATTSADPIVRR